MAILGFAGLRIHGPVVPTVDAAPRFGQRAGQVHAHVDWCGTGYLCALYNLQLLLCAAFNARTRGCHNCHGEGDFSY